MNTVSGSCPTLVIRVSNRTVTTDRETAFKKGSCRDIEPGTELKVEGQLMSDGSVRAEKVELERR